MSKIRNTGIGGLVKLIFLFLNPIKSGWGQNWDTADNVLYL